MKVPVWLTERRRWTFFGPLLFLFFVYLLGLVVQMPLRVAAGLFPMPSNVRLDGVDDSAWVGEVESLVVAGREVGRLQYLVNPWKLFLAKLEYALVLDDSSHRIEGVVNRSLWSGAISLNEVQGTWDMSLFNELMPAPLVVAGAVSIALESGDWQPGEFLEIKGEVQWDRALFGLSEGATFGTVVFDLQPADDGTLVKIGSREGEVLVAGNVFLEAEGRFESQIELRPGEKLTPAGRRLLGLAGAAGSGGMLKHTGSLF